MRDDDEKLEDLDLDMDEFFPLDDNLDMMSDGGNKNAPPTFKSYTKNVIKSAGVGAKGLLDAFLPSAGELFSELKMAKDTGVENLEKKLQDVVTYKDKFTGGGSKRDLIRRVGREIGKDLKYSLKTGDFTFGTQDLGFDFDDFEDQVDGKIDKSETKSAKATEKLAKVTTMTAEQSAKNALNFHKSETLQNYKLYDASQKREDMRHIANMAYISNIDSNVTKIAKYFGTIGTKSVLAQMEYSEKALALQQDSVKLLNMIKDHTFIPNNEDQYNKNKSKGILNSIFGLGLDGEGWMNAIMRNAGDMLSDSPIGVLMSSVQAMADMQGMGPKKSAGNALMGQILGQVPGLLLNTDSRIKLSNLDDLIGSGMGLFNAKFNQMAMTSDNPILRSLGNLLGVKELSVKKVDLGIKDLNAKANFDMRFYKTVTDAIPGLLSKILAATSGEGEVYYDFKSGTFKSGEQAIREYQYARDNVYQSSFKLNEVSDRITMQSDMFAKERNPDLSGKELGEESRRIRKDFETIVRNIASTNSAFDPYTFATDESYQKLISKGVSDPNNVIAFVRAFGDDKTGLGMDDKLAFAQGVDEVRRNLGSFYQEKVPDMIRSSSGGSFVADALIDEQIEEAKRLMEYQDAGRHMSEGNISQNVAKLKRLQAEENIRMKFAGRVGTTKSFDPTNIGDIANKGVGKSSLSILSNIYELLLGGIMVYPRKQIPDHLLNNIKNYNKFKDKYKEELDLKKLQEEVADEELRVARRDQYKRNVEVGASVGSLMSSTTERLGLGSLKNKISDRISGLSDAAKTKMFEALYGKNEAKNLDADSYEKRLAEAAEVGSYILTESFGELLGSSDSTKTAATKDAVDYEDYQKQLHDLKDEDFLNKIIPYFKTKGKQLGQEIYGGKVNYDKLKEMYKSGVLGEAKKEEEKTITRIGLPGEASDIDFGEGSKQYRGGSLLVKPDQTFVDYFSSIDKNVQNIFALLSNDSKLSSGTKKGDDIRSESVLDAVDRLRKTNKNFFDYIRESGIVGSINKMGHDMSTFNINLENMSGNIKIMVAKLLDGVSFPGLSPEMLAQLRQGSPKGLIGRVINWSKSGLIKMKRGAGSIFDSITNMLPGLGSGLGSGAGNIFSILTGGLKGGSEILGKGLGAAGSVLGSGYNWITDKNNLKNLKGLGGRALSSIGGLFSRNKGEKSEGKGRGGLLSGLGKGVGGILSGLGGGARGIGKILSGLGGGAKDIIGKIFDLNKDDSTDIEGSDSIKRRSHLSSEDALNEILHEVTLIRVGLGHKQKGIVGRTFDTVKDIFGNILKLPFGKVGSKIRSKFGEAKEHLDGAFVSKFNATGLKKGGKYREGSYLDHLEDERRDEKRENSNILTDSIVEIRDLLRKYMKPRMDVKKVHKDFIGQLEDSEISEQLDDIERSAGSGGGWKGKLKTLGGLAVGGASAAAIGYTLKKSIFDKNKLNEETGLYEDGSTGDIAGSHLGVDGDSKYGFDGRELSTSQRMSQSASLGKTRVASAKVLHGGLKMGAKSAKDALGSAKGKLAKVPGGSKAMKAAGKGGSKLMKVLKNVPGFIKSLFDKILKSKAVKKVVSPRMAAGIKKGLSKLLKPGLFKGAMKGLAPRLAKLIGPLGVVLTVNDFLTGLNSTSRYFGLGAGAKPSLGMRITSGVANVLSGLLFGIIPTDMIVNTIYGFIGGEETKQYISDYKKFNAEKAKILGVPSGPLSEFETKNIWQRLFGSGKKDAGLLKFGTDDEGVDKFKEWKNKLYKPVEDLRKDISKQFGGEGEVGGIPSSEAERAKQKAFREKFLSAARDYAGNVNLNYKSSGQNKTYEEVMDEGPDSDNKMIKTDAKSLATNATTAGAMVGGMALGGNNKKSPDLDVDKKILDDSNIGDSKNKLNSINKEVGLPDSESIDPNMGAVATAAIGTKIHKPKKEDLKNIKITDEEKAKKGSGSPVLSAMDNLTRNINTELDALRAIYMEQNRHNTVSEEFFYKVMKLLSVLVDNSKATFDADVSRNELLAKMLIGDIDSKAADRMRKEYREAQKQSQEEKKKREHREPKIPSNVELGPAGSKSLVSGNQDAGEMSDNGNYINVDDQSSLSSEYIFEDGSTSGSSDIDTYIKEYKKNNPSFGDMNSNKTSNFIQNALFGSKATHEIYNRFIAIKHKGKHIGWKNIYIPKRNENGIRKGDVIIENKFFNGETQYSIDNTGENMSSLDIDFNKSVFGKGAKSIILNMNTGKDSDISETTASRRASEVVSYGGRI